MVAGPIFHFRVQYPQAGLNNPIPSAGCGVLYDVWDSRDWRWTLTGTAQGATNATARRKLYAKPATARDRMVTEDSAGPVTAWGSCGANAHSHEC